jgi:hypothetical protein
MTLMIDILQSQSSSVTACVGVFQSFYHFGYTLIAMLQTNLVRCSLAAILVSVIDKITTPLGLGWTYVLLGGICIFLLPLMLLEMRIGPKQRLKRKLLEDLVPPEPCTPASLEKPE